MQDEISLLDYIVINAWAEARLRGRTKLEIWRVSKLTGDSKSQAFRRVKALKTAKLIEATKPKAVARRAPDPRRRLQRQTKIERMARLAHFTATGRRPSRVVTSR